MDTKQLREKLESQAKQTVGYSEAENKESFMVGVSVAISKAITHYELEIEQLKSQINSYKSIGEIYHDDLKTLVNIISKYQE